MSRVDEEFERTLARINGRAWGVSIGLVLGFGLLIATLVLVMKGGTNVGAHLGLLRVFLPGYRVTVLGGVVGFVYAFVIGYAVGRLLGMVYNLIRGETN